MSLIEQFKKLEDTLTFYNIPTLTYFKQRLHREEIISKIKPYGIINEIIIQLYEWRNGINYFLIYNSENIHISVRNTFLLFRLNLLTLDEAIERYNFELTNPIGYGKDLFPIFSDMGGGYLYIDKDGKTPTLYYSSILRIRGAESCYESLETAIETIIECYRTGAIKIKDNGQFETEYLQVKKIAKELNPNCVYWN